MKSRSISSRAFVTVRILFIAIIAYLPAIVLRPLFIPDELRYSQIPQEMLATRDWVVPHFVGLVYFEKPVLGYWLVALCLSIFGEHEFAVRLPSFLATSATAFIAVELLLRYRRDAQKAVVVGGMYLLAPIVFAIGTLNILDATFTFFVSAALASMFLCSVAIGRQRIIWCIAAGIAAGLGILTKGFLGVVIPMSVVGPYLLWNRAVKDMLPWCILSFIMAFMVCLPWGWAIHVRDQDFWNYFFWEEHVRRFSSKKPQHREPPWYFVPILVGGILPWLPGVFASVQKISVPQDLLKRFCWCWAVMPFILLSISRGKLPTYILPCIAPLAVLVGDGIVDYCRRGDLRLYDRTARYFGGAILVLAVGLFIWQLTLLGGAKAFGSLPTLLSFVSALVMFGLSSFFMGRHQSWTSRLTWYAVGICAVYLASAVALPNKLLQDRAPGEDLKALTASVTSDDLLIVDHRLAASVGWYLHRTNFYVPFDANELSYGLARAEAHERFLQSDADVKNLITTANEHGKRAFALFKTQRWKQYKSILPPALSTEERGVLVLVRLA